MIVFFLRFIIFLILILILLPFQVLIILFFRKYIYLIPCFFHKLCSKVFGLKIKILGEISKNKPTLFVANHASYLDIIILGSLFKTSFIAKKEVSKWPLIGILAILQNTVFVDRKISSLKSQENSILKHLENKNNLVIFPEGTSSDGNQVLPFKSSLFNIFENKINTKIPIQITTIVYKKINGIHLNRSDRKKITWHSNMSLVPNALNVLKKFSIEIEVIFNKQFLPKTNNRKKIALHCWQKINYNLKNSLYR